MTSRRQSGLPIRALLAAIMILPTAALLLSIPWLKQQPDGLVFLLSGSAAALTVFASFALAIVHDRKIDEWERSNARFSSQWGWTAGASLVALLLALPSFRDWIVSVVADAVDVPDPNHKLVVLAFTFGFGAVVFTQGLCTALLAMGWAFWKSRAPRDPS